MKKLFIAYISVLMLATGCKKQPVACFTASKSVIELGESVSFTSCATDYASIEWDFGDGTTTEGESASHQFTKPGTFLVQMKALSKKGKKVDRYSVAITVNGYNRYLTKIVLKAVSATDDTGGDWDQTIGMNPNPDVFVRIALADDSWSATTGTETDLEQSALPITWNLTQNNYYLSNEDWVVEIKDDDSFGTSLSTETMSSFNVNPATTGTAGVITLSEGAYTVELHYTNR